MKILIAYDGTHGADVALDDLARAGLPADTQAMVLTVADASMALASRAFVMAETGVTSPPSDHWQEQAAAAVENARDIASGAAARLRTRFPGWRVSPDVWGRSAASSIVLKADAWRPDLIVVGSRGVRASRLLLGGVSRKVATEARCGVRIGRPPVSAEGDPLRILVGHDGGTGGRAALLAAGARSWPAHTEIRAVAVQDREPYLSPDPEHDPFVAPAAPGSLADRGALRKRLHQDAVSARRDGVPVSAEIEEGIAASVLLRIAREWKADCVFVGATHRSRESRFLLGSVSSVVADRAESSVEIVRAGTA